MSKRKNAFTLIELIAVLVIMAILALIVTPLVLNVVRKAKDSANKRSVDAYGKSIELAVASYLLDTGDFPKSIDELTIEYSGKEVVCGIKQLNEDSSVYLSECKVGNSEVKDASTEDGWYHYGKSSAQVYQSYKIGDQITYNGMNFYVIADSDEKSDSVTMLKAEPLTVDEVNTYGGVGTSNNHVNMYVTNNTGASYYQTASNQNGYGGMAYYSSETCKYYGDTGCTTDYAQSEVKYVVDAWAADKFKSSDLSVDATGYSARLISHNDLITNLGYENGQDTTQPSTNGTTPAWVYNSNYWYWTMSQQGDVDLYVFRVYSEGTLDNSFVHGYGDGGNCAVVRPVVSLLKSAL